MANLITQFENGTFEVPAVNGVNLVIDTVVFRTGAQSGKFTLANALGNPYIIEQLSFPAVVGTIYKYDAWIKTDSLTSSSKVSFILAPSFPEDDLIDFQTTQFRLADVTWRKISVTYRANVLSAGLSYVELLVINGVSYSALKALPNSLGTIVNSLSMNGTETYEDGSTMNVDDLFADVSTIPLDPQFGGQKLYYVENVFMLSDGTNLYQIEEPIGWDKIAMALTFDKDIRGFKFEFTDKDVELQFDDPAGRTLLNSIYDAKGTEGVAGLKFGQKDPVTHELEILFEGKINFDLFQKKQFTSVTTCQRQSLAITFANLYSTVFTLEQVTTLNKGVAIADLVKHLCYLQARETILNINGEYNANVSVTDEVPVEAEPSVGGFSTVPPIHYIVNDVADFMEPTPPDGELIYAGVTLPPGVVQRQFSIRCKVAFTFTTPPSPQPVSAALIFYKKSGISTGTDASAPIVTDADIFHTQSFGNGGGVHHFTGTCIGGVSLKADEALFMKVVFYSTGLFSMSDTAWEDTNTWEFVATDISPYAPSTFEGYRPFDVLSRMVTMMTDEVDVFRSDFLESGCGKDHIMGSGKMLRAFPGAQSKVCMKDVLTSFDMLCNVGMSFEWDNDGNETARLEEMPYFFQDVEMVKLNTIVDYIKSPANDLIFNEIEFGFTKTPQQDEPNSALEYLTKLNMLTPIKQVSQKLSKLCSLILAPTYIEEARRTSYQFNSTGQQPQDNDNFLIATLEDEVTNVNTNGVFDSVSKTLTCDKLVPVIEGDAITITLSGSNNGAFTVGKIYFRSLPGVEITTIQFRDNPVLVDETSGINIAFSSRLVPKRDEEFDSVTGINSPGTAYNLQHQLKRVIYRWAKYFKSGFSWAFNVDPITNPLRLRFTGMVANENLRTQLKSTVECYNIEQQDSLSDVGDKDNDKLSLMDDPIFTFNKIVCRAPMTWTTWNTIRKGLEGRHPEDKNYGYFTLLNPDGVYEKAYLYNGTFNPNTQMANLELREKYNG